MARKARYVAFYTWKPEGNKVYRLTVDAYNILQASKKAEREVGEDGEVFKVVTED